MNESSVEGIDRTEAATIRVRLGLRDVERDDRAD
jgi:hypothetical protein